MRLCLLVCGASLSWGAESGQKIFESHVKGILTQHCVRCHGGAATRGGLDLTTREGLLHEGENGPVVIPGKGEQSRLYRLVARLEQPHMPFKSPKLDDAAIQAIKVWIDAGAPYSTPLIEKNRKTRESGTTSEKDREFWSFRPLVRHTPPPVPEGDGHAWPRTAIDQFILAAQQARKLQPNPVETDRRVLIRRVYLDVLGIPPTFEEIQQFVDDPASDAYARLVDRVLASPHYGERWGRHWLDLARYAESHGYEQDYDRPTAYHYRDFVIKALNSDMPYDQFVRWQIAGDELAPDNPLALMATGFLGAGTHATQITANQVEKERYDELDDMGGTIGTAMLGLTLTCARCHDHKYDPITMRDYYRFIANFTTTVRSDQEIELDRERFQREWAVYQQAHAPFEKRLTDFRAQQLPARMQQWLATQTSAPRPDWMILKPTEFKSSGGAEVEHLDDGSVLVKGKNGIQDSYSVTVDLGAGKFTGLRLETLPDDRLPQGGPGRGPTGNFALCRCDVKWGLKAEKPTWTGIAIKQVVADFEETGGAASGVLDQEAATAWGIAPRTGESHFLVLKFEQPLEVKAPTRLSLSLSFNKSAQHGIGRMRLAVTEVPTVPAGDTPGLTSQQLQQIAAALPLPQDKRTPEQLKAISRWVELNDPDARELQRQADAHDRSRPRRNRVTAMICSEGVPAIRLHTQGGDFLEQTHFLKRGNPNQKQEVMQAGFLEVLSRSPQGSQHWQVAPPVGWRTSYRRVGLARWITDLDQGAGALLARVIVNRLWQHHFGRGIVNTPSDFGSQGDRPSHPELLDWLATELVREQWRMKPLHKLMLMSAVYQQTTTDGTNRSSIDPEGRLYWRRPLIRLEAEPLRDQMLALSGIWDKTPFGPGSLDEGQHRRSIYYMIKRSQLVPMMVLFDGPDTLQGLGQRATTTVAPQALAMLNNKFVREFARGFAQRIQAMQLSPELSLRRAYLEAYTRIPTTEEVSEGLAFLQQQQATHAVSQPGRAAETLAWTDLCQALLCANEFVYIP